MLLEHARAHHRDLVKERDLHLGDRAEARIGGAELRTLEHARDALAGEGDSDAHDDLVEPQPDAEHDHERARDHAAHRAEPEAEP